MRAIWSVRPKCSHRCVSLKETSLNPVQIFKCTTKNSAEKTAMRTKSFKHIAILTVQVHLLLSGKEKHVNINKFAGLSRDWVGAKSCLCVLFSGHSLWGRKKAHKHKVPQTSRDNPVKILFTCFFAPNLRYEMKSPHLVDYSWDLVDFWSILSRILADFWLILAEISWDKPILAEILRPNRRNSLTKSTKVAERTCKDRAQKCRLSQQTEDFADSPLLLQIKHLEGSALKTPLTIFWSCFLQQKYIFSGYFLRPSPKIPFKTSIKITSCFWFFFFFGLARLFPNK